MFEKPLDMMMIEWMDSCGTTEGWEYKDEIEPIVPTRCISVGFVLDSTPEYITLLQNDSEMQVLGRMAIPTCSVMETWNLEKIERPEL